MLSEPLSPVDAGGGGGGGGAPVESSAAPGIVISIFSENSGLPSCSATASIM